MRGVHDGKDKAGVRTGVPGGSSDTHFGPEEERGNCELIRRSFAFPQPISEPWVDRLAFHREDAEDALGRQVR